MGRRCCGHGAAGARCQCQHPRQHSATRNRFLAAMSLFRVVPPMSHSAESPGRQSHWPSRRVCTLPHWSSEVIPLLPSSHPSFLHPSAFPLPPSLQGCAGLPGQAVPQVQQPVSSAPGWQAQPLCLGGLLPNRSRCALGGCMWLHAHCPHVQVHNMRWPQLQNFHPPPAQPRLHW